MKGRLFNLTALLSLAVCLAACVEWARSYDVGHMLLRGGHGSMVEITTGRGGIGISYAEFTSPIFTLAPEPGRWRLVTWSPRWSSPSRFPSFLGFTWALRHRAPAVTSFWHVGAPLWFVVLLTGSAPALLARKVWLRRRRRARLHRGASAGCGYDLRGTPHRCPECGDASPRTHDPALDMPVGPVRATDETQGRTEGFRSARRTCPSSGV
jgi:hypothetical protein